MVLWMQRREALLFAEMFAFGIKILNVKKRRNVLLTRAKNWPAVQQLTAKEQNKQYSEANRFTHVSQFQFLKHNYPFFIIFSHFFI